MAPEIVSAQGAELRSDLFSVGVILYEIVTGTPSRCRKNPEVPAGKAPIDKVLEKIILKATAKERKGALLQRFRDAPGFAGLS